MKLLFKQRMFSWLDSYDIYDEDGEVVYTVKSKLSWGHCLKIFNKYGEEIGMVKEVVLSFLPKFEMYEKGRYIGCIRKELSFFSPKFNIEYKEWSVEGNWLETDYRIIDKYGLCVATVSKEWFRWTDTYVIDVDFDEEAIYALMLVLAIDAEKCSRQS